MLLWIAVLLPSLILATDTNWQYQIYVSSSDGTNSSSCWNGSVPCNTLNLALQGVQHNSTVIYLHPGIYTLDHEVRNISRVAIIGLSNDVTISCQPLTGQWLGNVIFQCITFYNCSTTINNSIPCPYNVTKNCDYCNEGDNNELHVDVFGSVVQPGQAINFTASLYDSCSDKEYIVKSNLTVCIVSGPELVKLCSTNSNCTNTSINSLNQYSFSICYFDKNDSTVDIEVMISVQSLNILTNKNLTIEPRCDYINSDLNASVYLLNATSGNCEYICNILSDCSVYLLAPLCYFDRTFVDTCASNRTGRLCGSCEDGYSVPINLPHKCVQCDPLIGWISIVIIELLPVTLMVLLIIVLNIQLTSGSINGLVFYCQILTAVYPGLTLNSLYGSLCNSVPIALVPLNILNLDFTLFLANYSLCVSSTTTPLGALSFWYVIGLYPLVLLLLLYVWITLYNKGYKVIVLITRPIHRLLARFWRMTNIEPSLPHSIASIYLLCFMQLATTSFKLLHFSIYDHGKLVFYYDGSLDYFGWPHCLAGIFAILVLILLVLIPMLYIQLYPFKPFHKLLECLHLNKLQILTSLGDVFTGPYKNGTTNKLDYRYFAGFYLLLRIIIVLLHFIPYVFILIVVLQACFFGLFCGAIMIFRPYQKNVNNFNEFFLFFVLSVLNFGYSVYNVVVNYDKIRVVFYYFVVYVLNIIYVSFNWFVFGVILFGYFIYWTTKKIKSCYGYHRAQGLLPSNTVNVIDDAHKLQDVIDDNDWIADRMINPQNYDEQHSPITPYQLHKMETTINS